MLLSGEPDRPLSQRELDSLNQLLIGTPPTSTTSRRLRSTVVRDASLGINNLDSLEEAEKIAWDDLETELRLLEETADILPVLKSAVGEVIACLYTVQTAQVKDEEYEELAVGLGATTKNLTQSVQKWASGGFEDESTIITLCGTIKTIVENIGEQAPIKATEGGESPIQSYRQIKALFRQIQNLLDIESERRANESLMAFLFQNLSPAEDARYNSSYADIIGRQECMPGTREEIQAALRHWVHDPYAAKIFWMGCVAGTGKTTVAYSLCKWLEAEGRLGASFFCSRLSAPCRNASAIVPAIAYQLACRFPGFRLELCRAVEKGLGEGKPDVVQQFTQLVREPLRAAKDTMSGAVVVIDALDECDDYYGVRRILQTLLQSARDLPLKFFLPGRPEPTISEVMLCADERALISLHLDDIEKSTVELDVKKYLAATLKTTSPPLSDGDIGTLAKRAGTLFVYAITAARYLNVNPSEFDLGIRAQFGDIIAKGSTPSYRLDRSTKNYNELDQLYGAILAPAFSQTLSPDEQRARQLLLWTVVCAKEPMTVGSLALFTEGDEGQVLPMLNCFQPVLRIFGEGRLVTISHVSFADYMLDKMRSRNYYLEESGHNRWLAGRCFEIMKEQLRFNICDLEAPFTFDKDVPDLMERVQRAVSPSLFYACRYWSEHLKLAAFGDELNDHLADFLSQRLPFWIEVMNLAKCIDMSVTMLCHAHNWLLQNYSKTDAIEQTIEAQRLVTLFTANPCRLVTSSIYTLPFAFPCRTISTCANHWGHTSGIVGTRGVLPELIERAAVATWNVGSIITAIAFSPDGSLIVSGSVSGTVLVWNVDTGDIINDHDGYAKHTSRVSSLAFSPDGSRFVSGSYDRTTRLWEVHPGSAIATTVQRGTERVSWVAFSPTGSHFTSGYFDHTTRAWDTHTGALVVGPFSGEDSGFVPLPPDIYRVGYLDDETFSVRLVRPGTFAAESVNPFGGEVVARAISPNRSCTALGTLDGTIQLDFVGDKTTSAKTLRGHSSAVGLVAFSPDGSHIASASFDCTIRLWSAHTDSGDSKPFKGHMNSVMSVAFAPNGQSFVSGSYDHTCQIWDTCTGVPLTKPLRGHTNPVSSVTFSPDSSRVVSGSYDNTIRVWDAYTGTTIVGPLKGHTNGVSSIAFSPDGSCFASGSFDCTIRVWESYTGTVIAGPFEGHTHRVSSVAFSPDGSSVASASSDRTIRLWNVHTGAATSPPFQGHNSSVTSVAFAPNGRHVASGSSDCSIRMWDIETGTPVVEIFKGHTGPVNSVAFSPDGSRIVSGSSDCTIRVWDTHTGWAVSQPFEGHTGSVTSVALSPDGLRVVSACSGSTIRMWDLTFNPCLIRPDGWIMCDDIPLIWVPADRQHLVPLAPSVLIISQRNLAYINYRALLQGFR